MEAESTAALVLVGGFGTRLRPLTFTCDKPLVPFMNVPMIVHQLSALRDAGVKVVMLAVSRASVDSVCRGVRPWADRLGMTVVTSVEDEPRGTGGAVCDGVVKLDRFDTVIVLNSDVYREDFDISGVFDARQASGAICAVQTAFAHDPSSFGVVCADEQRVVQSFEEKPSRYKSGMWVNAGVYCIDRKRFLEFVNNDMTSTVSSIERDIFPVLVSAKHMVEARNTSYWSDLGTPDALIAASDYVLSRQTCAATRAGGLALSSIRARDSFISAEAGVSGSVMRSTVGAGCVIERGAVVKRCILMSGVTVKSGAILVDTIVGNNVYVEGFVNLTRCVIGDSVRISEHTTHDSVRYAPNLAVTRTYMLRKSRYHDVFDF